MSYLSIQGLHKSYGATAIFSDINCEIGKGEFITLLGPSGCGKSTLLRCIAGLTGVNGGQILLDGQDLVPVAPQKRGIGMVFQSYALFPNMTVQQNVAFGLRMLKVKGSEAEQRVKQALEMVELNDFAGRYPQQLSGGQCQRVALARSLVTRPRLLLLDEPLSALDARIRKHLREQIRAIQRELGLTTIFVTHDQEEALVMSDRMAVLDGGKVCQCGSPSELYENPNSRFVANFIGVSNLFEGVRSGQHSVRVNGQELNVETDAPLVPGQPVAVVVRPERLQVLGEGETCANQVSGQIVEIAYHGLDTNLHVQTAFSDKPLIVRVPSSQCEFAHFAMGMHVRLGWQARHARVLTR